MTLLPQTRQIKCIAGYPNCPTSSIYLPAAESMTIHTINIIYISSICLGLWLDKTEDNFFKK